MFIPTVLLVLAGAALIWGAYSASRHPEHSGPMTLAAAIVAGIALAFNALHVARQGRIRFTLDATFQRFSNSVYASHAVVLFRYRKQIAAARTVEDLEKLPVDPSAPEGASVAEALISILNYWEFVTTAYVDGHLDRETFGDVAGELIETLVERSKTLIGAIRTGDAANWEHLLAVYFCVASPEERRRVIPSLGPPPPRLCPHEEFLWERIQGKA
ncbi:MAG TPA: hypothetical protein VF759_14525 [Allosphingosinicella sp.]|jgi:hypothetical protein